MPRRRNSKLNRAIRAAVHEEIREKQRVARDQRQQTAESDASIITSACEEERIQQAEEIAQAIQDQRLVVTKEQRSSVDQATTTQVQEVIATVRRAFTQPESSDDILQIIEDEPIL